jgi:predicted lysophospholipase L1 biosynthesis ABC-type transport system permease subunit
MSGALVMAAVLAIGLFAALKFYIESRRRELAIRVCLGAGTGSIRGGFTQSALVRRFGDRSINARHLCS